MEKCVRCGKNARKIVWAMYADEAFAGKPNQAPFPLHEKCFNASETIIASEWVERADKPEPQRGVTPTHEDLYTIREFEAPRYRRVNAPTVEDPTDG